MCLLTKSYIENILYLLPHQKINSSRNNIFSVLSLTRVKIEVGQGSGRYTCHRSLASGSDGLAVRPHQSLALQEAVQIAQLR